MKDKSIIELLGEVKNDLEYEILDAWEEQANGLFEYRGTGEHGVQHALTTLTEVMERLNSKELLQEIRMAVQLSDVQTERNGYKTIMPPMTAEKAARAAIATIKGEKK